MYEPELEGAFSNLRDLLSRLQPFDNGAEDDEDDYPPRGWNWDSSPPAAMIRGHHRHGLPDMFEVVGGESLRGE